MTGAKIAIPLIITFGIAGMVTAYSIQKEHPTASEVLKFLSLGWASTASLIYAIATRKA